MSIHNKAAGEKAWPPLMMFKVLLLQSWYKLSDPQLEKQLARDLNVVDFELFIIGGQQGNNFGYSPSITKTKRMI